MAKKNIGATISLKDGGFNSGIKSAISSLGSFKKGSESATSASKKFGKQNDTAGSSLSTLAKRVVGVVAAYASFTKIVDFSKQCIEAANTQAMAEERLAATLSNVKGTTDAQISSLKTYASELQRSTTVGDEATIQGMSQLGTFQLQADIIKTLTPALLDLAVAQYGTAVSGDQMQQMANLMGKVMAGNVGALSRYGVIMDDTQKKILKTGTESQKAAMLVEVLGQNFGGMAEKMANTPSGRVQQLKNAWGDMQEVIGVKLYPIITKFLGYMTEKIPTIQGALTTAVNVVVPIVSGAFDLFTGALNIIGPMLLGIANNWEIIAAALAPVITAMLAYKAAVGLTNVMQNICNLTMGLSAAEMGAMSFAELAAATGKGIHTAATGALTAAQTALNAAFLASPIGWIVLGIAAVVAGVILLYKKCDVFREFVNKLFGNIVNWAKSAWEAIKVVWDIVYPYFDMMWKNIQAVFAVWKVYITGLFTTAWTIIKAVWDTVIGYFTAIWNTIKGIFAVVKAVFSGDWQGAWEAIKGIVNTWAAFFQGVWDSIVSIFSAVGTWFGDTFSAAWEGIKAIFANVAGFFQGIWDTITGMFVKIGTTIGDGISGAFKTVINSVISFAGNLINGFINSINWAIDVINNIPGVSITRLQTVNLPMLANGGVIRRSGDVIVGERGPERLTLPQGAKVTPLTKEKNTQNNITININATRMTVDEIVSNLVPKLKFALNNM